MPRSKRHRGRLAKSKILHKEGFMLLALLAQTTDYGTSASDAAAATAAVTGAGLLFGGLALFWLIYAILSLFFFIWWIVLIIDLTKRDWPQKTTYLILMIVSLFVPFMMVIMDFVYYFGIVKKGVGSKAA